MRIICFNLGIGVVGPVQESRNVPPEDQSYSLTVQSRDDLKRWTTLFVEEPELKHILHELRVPDTDQNVARALAGTSVILSGLILSTSAIEAVGFRPTRSDARATAAI